VFVSAGLSRRVPFGTWLMMDGFAALISVPIWVYLGYFGALNRDWMFSVLRQFQVGIFVLLGIGALVGGVIWWRRRKASQLQP
ncbi:MAG: DedA family protein, partial [Betaproteobacteria bacterium]